MDTFVILKILSLLVMPPASLAVGALAWLLLRLVGARRLGGILLGLTVAQTVVMSLPVVTVMLIGELERQARKIVADAPACCYDAIVVLGGGVMPASPPYIMEPDLTDAADRVWEAARLYHRGAAPRIIVSGGSFIAQQGGPATSEAEAMRRFLLDLGVPDQAIVAEGKSLNTIENIRNVRDIVKGGRVALVTSAYHMPRSAGLARRAGLDFAAFATDWAAPNAARPFWENWVPSGGSLGMSTVAARELLALAFDRRGNSLGS